MTERSNSDGSRGGYRRRTPGAADHGTADGVFDEAMVHYAFEDFVQGQIIELGTAHVDREEMLAFARAYDPQPFHIDEQAAKASVLGGLCASGWFTCSLWMRQQVRAVLADSTSQGSPGGRELAWPAPVFPGDDLRCTTLVGPTRLSASRPGLGLVEFTGSASRRTPDGAGDAEQVVMRITFTGLFAVRAGITHP